MDFDDEGIDRLGLEIARGISMTLLSPFARSQIEAGVSGAHQGDIERGSLILYHTDFRQFPLALGIGYYLRDDPEFRTTILEILSKDNVDSVVGAFQVLAEWAQKGDG